jgi:hypothetical protein
MFLVTMKKPILVHEVRVRPLQDTERERFEALMAEKHYLGWGRPVGETLYYVAEHAGEWVALQVFGAAAYALADRDEWQRQYGHTVVMVETIVDPERYEGTCYRPPVGSLWD